MAMKFSHSLFISMIGQMIGAVMSLVIGPSVGLAGPAALSRGSCRAVFVAQNPALVLAEAVEQQGFQHLRIDERFIVRVAKKIAGTGYAMVRPKWNEAPYPPPTLSVNETFRFFVTLGALNYMYWDPITGATYGDSKHHGAALLVQRLSSQWPVFSDARRLRSLTADDVAMLFLAPVPLPLPADRARALNEVGRFFERYAERDWRQWLSERDDALTLAEFLVSEMPFAFGDPFLKRAQLTAAMLIGRMGADGLLQPELMRAERLTAFADYILPMVLVNMGVLDLSAALREKIDAGVQIAPDSREEIELRAATILAANRLLVALRRYPQYRHLTILELDAALWLQAGEIEFPGSKLDRSVFLGVALKRHHRTPRRYY